MKLNTLNRRKKELACCYAVLLLFTSTLIPAWAADPGSADAARVAVEGIQQAGPRTGVTLPELLQVGPFQIRPYFAGSMLYDDNIRIQSSNAIHDVVWTLSPGILIGGGQYQDKNGTFLSLDYRPDIVLYTDNSTFNSVDHYVNGFGQKHWEKLTLGLGQAFQSGTGGYTEALNRVERSVYVTTFQAAYDLSDKTSFQLNGLQNISDYAEDVNGLTSYNQWEAQAWGNYQLTPKVNVGLGGTVGWYDVLGAKNQTYQQALLRGTYKFSPKLQFTGKAGLEFQQYQDSGDRGPQFIFDLGGAYQFRERTALTLNAYRRNQVSVVLRGENYTTTGIKASIRQRFRDKIYLTLTGGYEASSYYSAGSTTPTGRRDDYFYIGPAIDYQVTDRWFLGMFYRYRDNNSNQRRNDFKNNQVGLRTLFRY